MIIIGRNPVLEALKSGKNIEKILVIKNGEGSIKKIIGKAYDLGIDVNSVDRKALDREAEGGNHQGIIAYVEDFKYSSIDDVFLRAREFGEEPFILILDSIEDPHNLGAIIRTADGAGVHGVIIPKRRSSGVTSVVNRVSVGATEYVPVVQVNNLSQTLDVLKKRGMWIAALDMDGDVYNGADLKGSMGLIIGNEGKGVSMKLKEKSDFVLSIPMRGMVNSLNASNASAVLMYEVRRQRDGR